MPVRDGQQLVGLVTDLESTLHAMAHGGAADGATPCEVMSTGLSWCCEDQAVEKVLDQRP